METGPPNVQRRKLTQKGQSLVVPPLSTSLTLRQCYLKLTEEQQEPPLLGHRATVGIFLTQCQ